MWAKGGWLIVAEVVDVNGGEEDEGLTGDFLVVVWVVEVKSLFSVLVTDGRVGKETVEESVMSSGSLVVEVDVGDVTVEGEGDEETEKDFPGDMRSGRVDAFFDETISEGKETLRADFNLTWNSSRPPVSDWIEADPGGRVCETKVGEGEDTSEGTS